MPLLIFFFCIGRAPGLFELRLLMADPGVQHGMVALRGLAHPGRAQPKTSVSSATKRRPPRGIVQSCDTRFILVPSSSAPVVDRLAQTLFKRAFPGRKPEPVSRALGVESAPGLPVGFALVPDELALLETHHAAEQRRQVANRDLPGRCRY